MKSKIFTLLLSCFVCLASMGQTGKFSMDPTSQPAHFVRFYPNPATAVVNFDFVRGYNANYSLLIFNFMGKKVYELRNTPSRVNINLEDFFRGIYIYQLRNGSGIVVESGKFQVVK